MEEEFVNVFRRRFTYPRHTLQHVVQCLFFFDEIEGLFRSVARDAAGIIVGANEHAEGNKLLTSYTQFIKDVVERNHLRMDHDIRRASLLFAGYRQISDELR